MLSFVVVNFDVQVFLITMLAPQKGGYFEACAAAGFGLGQGA
jgi:hypothetical protein